MLAGFGGPVAADAPVVVELFTSQGCSSCPPADALLHELAERDDVIALALHVDYWDYIGWTDEFADPAHSLRQQAYARVAGESMVFTPQVILNGREAIIGNRTGEVRDRIDAHLRVPSSVDLTLERQPGALRIRASGADGAVNVHLVRYAPRRSVAILAGENAGRDFDYANVVTDWRTVGAWDGNEPLDAMIEMDEGGPVAVLLQEPGPGAIVAAAVLP